MHSFLFSFGFFVGGGGGFVLFLVSFHSIPKYVHTRFVMCSLRCLQLHFIFCPMLFGYDLTSMYITCKDNGTMGSLTKQTTILQREAY
jgi:hypothetical protein